jgi:CHAT domain-containing protein
MRDSGLPRLKFTRGEAQGLAALVPKAHPLEKVDFAASKANATSGLLSPYRLVHFATHGSLDSEHPELSGVVLSMVNEKGSPVDGFLRLHDIFNLKLPAELVVLSACETALGKEIKGEGLIGLTRGFMYAGTPRVVVSLWSVDDEATAELMKRFYQGMLIKKLSPPAALRAAQTSLGSDPRWKAPYYWGAFILQGEWKSLSPHSVRRVSGGR